MDDANTSIEGGISFGDLVNVAELQNLLEVNYAATGMPSGIIDVESGEVYAGAGWQDICVKFHRVQPEANAICIKNDTAIINKVKGGKPCGYKCDHGLWDIGVPIYCEGRYVATYFLGQFLYEDESIDKDRFIAQAERFGFDKHDYLKALDAVPRFSREKVNEILKYNTAMAAFLSHMISQNLRVKRELVERRRMEHELRRLQTFSANIINSMPSTLIGVDVNGVVSHWNDRAVRETGIKEKEALGVSLASLLPHMAEYVEHIDEAVRSRHKLEYLKRAWQKDGETRYEDVVIYPLMTNGTGGVVIRIDDVTERVQLEQMMVQSEKMMSVGGLAAGMAHEINNPLAAILGYTHNIKKRLMGSLEKNEIMARQCGLDLNCLNKYIQGREVAQMLDGISESGERAAAIVSNMLSFSRKSERRFSEQSLPDLLDKTLQLAANDYDLKKEYDFRKIKIEKEYMPDMPSVLCEATEIQQVFLNLFKNGAEAMAEKEYGDSYPRLKIGLRRESDYAVVEIEDNGSGMPEHVRKRVFEPFFTSKEPGKGTGLGLSVSYFIIADQHGGKMDVTSQPGAWTRFTIRIPFVPKE